MRCFLSGGWSARLWLSRKSQATRFWTALERVWVLLAVLERDFCACGSHSGEDGAEDGAEAEDGDEASCFSCKDISSALTT
jgi:hypothetical protein